MRIILLLLFFPLALQSQTTIKKEVDSFTGETSYSSDILSFKKLYPLHFISLSLDKENEIYFTIHGYTPQYEYSSEIETIFIKFANGDVAKYSGFGDCDVTTYLDQIMYSCYGSFKMYPEDVDQYLKKKLKGFRIENGFECPDIVSLYSSMALNKKSTLKYLNDMFEQSKRDLKFLREIQLKNE